MTRVTRRQVGKAAAWTVPVIALGAAAPAATASEVSTDYCACLQPSLLSFDPGTWVSDELAANPAGGTYWDVTNNMHYPICELTDDYFIDFANTSVSVTTTEGPLSIFGVDLEGGEVHQALGFFPVSLHFASTEWEWAPTADHHVTQVIVHTQLHVYAILEPVDQVCPTPITLTYTFAQNDFGTWNGFGNATVAIS